MRTRLISVAVLLLTVVIQQDEASAGSRRCCCCKDSSRDSVGTGERGARSAATNRNGETPTVSSPFNGAQPTPQTSGQTPGSSSGNDDDSAKRHEIIQKQLVESGRLLADMLENSTNSAFVSLLEKELTQKPEDGAIEALKKRYPKK